MFSPVQQHLMAVISSEQIKWLWQALRWLCGRVVEGAVIEVSDIKLWELKVWDGSMSWWEQLHDFFFFWGPIFLSRTKWHSLVVVSNGCKVRPALTLLKIKKGQQSSVFMGCSKYIWAQIGAFIITTVHFFYYILTKCGCSESELVYKSSFCIWAPWYLQVHPINLNETFNCIPYILESMKFHNLQQLHQANCEKPVQYSHMEE